MNKYQTELFEAIQKAKKNPKYDPKILAQMVKDLVKYDDVSSEIASSIHMRQGRSGSRSASFGVWYKNDN